MMLNGSPGAEVRSSGIAPSSAIHALNGSPASLSSSAMRLTPAGRSSRARRSEISLSSSRTRLPLSSSMAMIVSGVAVDVSGAATAPARIAPRKARPVVTAFIAAMATGSCLCTPSRCRAVAMRSSRASISAQPTVRFSSASATASPRLAAWARRMSLSGVNSLSTISSIRIAVLRSAVELLACSRLPLQQGCDGKAVLLQARDHRLEPDMIGPEHRPAGPCRPAIAVEPDGIDIARPLRNAFLEDQCAFADHRIEQAFADLVLVNRALWLAFLLGEIRDDRLHFVRRRTLAVVVVVVEALLRLLPPAADRAQRIAQCLDPIGIAVPADVHTGKIGHLPRPHRETEFEQRLVHVPIVRAFHDQRMGL